VVRVKRSRREDEPVQGGILPNFFIIGAMKAGTTSLYHYLQDHPQVFMSTPKELHFFVEDWNWRWGWKWYQDHFSLAGDAVAIGEASVTYSMHPTHPGVAARIFRFLPHARLAYILRHPIDRIRSEYSHRVLIGKEKRPLERAVTEDSRYVNNSRYALQLERYLQYFPRDQLLLLTSDELRSDRMAAVRRVASFLGIDPDWTWPSLNEEHYRTDERRELPPLLARAREFRFVRALARPIPRPLKEAARRPATQHLQLERAEVLGDVREELAGLLEDDQRRLRSYLGDAVDRWGIIKG
jgi:hypothetical protein